MSRKVIAPGSTIGVIGSGQLGRMTALSAARLGYRVHVYSPENDSPTEQVCDVATVAPYDDTDALKKFADAVDVITFEFENIPYESVQLLAETKPVHPRWECLYIARNRVREKQFVADCGIGTAPWREVNSESDVAAALVDIGRPSILKTAELGYDGKGQIRIDSEMTAAKAWETFGDAGQGVLEGMVDFTREVSVIVARSETGEMRCYDPVENRHKDGILDVTIAPATIDEEVAATAIEIAETLAEKMELVGLLAVEMFVLRGGRLLVNEMAPRPHNSGHWTIDACVTSQFEQFVRSVCGLPLGNPARHSNAVMQNLIGDDVKTWSTVLGNPSAKLHLYGKAEPRPGRKMGHVTRITRIGEAED
ncbi:MAG: 5-(carboxyamino)imidazole ribonucleotide synthase [Rhodospirillales bacterium]